jgi:hypothetical protein
VSMQSRAVALVVLTLLLAGVPTAATPPSR